MGMIRQQLHGYRQGHQLLASSIALTREDQDAVDRLSDISGSLGPGEQFEPYLTSYPLPSGRFNILARTWQDYDAPRAGCVLTRSLVIPANDWAEAASLEDYLAMLAPFSRDTKIVDEVATGKVPGPKADFLASRVEELMDALFLGPNTPVVAFGFEGNAEYIAVRLLTALWPELRSRYCVSTFSLGAQSVSGKYFDLLFASASSRQRFGNFECKRVTMSGVREFQNRWAEQLAQNVFDHEPPRLVSPRALITLGGIGKSDERDIKIVLLWADLLEQSNKSPSATLGLLDILNSRGRLDAEIEQVRIPSVRAIETVAQNGNTRELLQYVDTLSTKLLSAKAPLSISKAAWKAVRNAAAKDPHETLNYLQIRGPTKPGGPNLVVAAIGDGIDVGVTVDESGKFAFQFPGGLPLHLCGASRQFAEGAVTLVGSAGNPKPIVEKIFGGLSLFQDEDRRPLVHRVLPLLSSAVHADILAALLRNADSEVILKALFAVWRSTRMSVPEFDEPLLNAARDASSLNNGSEFNLSRFRGFVADLPETPDTDRLLLNCLAFRAQDIQWACNYEPLTSIRSARLLAELIARATDSQLSGVFGSGDLALSVLQRLSVVAFDAPNQLARLMLACSDQVDFDLTLVPGLLSGIDESLRAPLARTTIRRGFSRADQQRSQAIEKIIDTGLVSMADIVVFAITADASRRNVGSNLALLNGLQDPSTRGELMRHLESLSNLLARAPVWSLGEEGIRVWASLISDAWRWYRQATIGPAWIAFEYALNQAHAPLGALAEASFPIVYQHINTGGQIPYFSSIFSIFDWDLRKAVCKHVVRAFMESKWEPRRLVIAAVNAGALDLVIDQLHVRWRGDDYLREMRQSIVGDKSGLDQLDYALSKLDGALDRRIF